VFSTVKKSKYVKSAIGHNKSIFLKNKKIDGTSNMILVEVNNMASSHISYSYLTNILSKKYSANIVGYHPGIIDSLRANISGFIRKFINTYPYDIYRSFGVDMFLSYKINKYQKNRANKIFNSSVLDLKTKKDVEDFSIDNVWIGDLIYDSYLREFNKPTIDISSNEFLEHLLNSIKLYIYWSDFIAENNVCALIISHNVYLNAIPMRISARKNIPVYQINIQQLYYLTTENLFSYADFFNYPKTFSSLSKVDQIYGIKESKRRIERRFSGEVGVDMEYSTKSAYGKAGSSRVLNVSNKKKILIATHCFFDSPHSFCNNIFTDFYEWLDYLGSVSIETDYEWYIKVHPDYLDGTMEVVQEFVNKYTKFVLLPSDVSHHQLIDEGVDVALTVYGTIGFEYAALGIPVINGSICNPHVAYNFNLHPRNMEEYSSLIYNIHNIDIKINKNEIYEYYFMKNIHNSDNLFFDNYNSTIEKMGGYSSQFTPEIYINWISEWNKERHDKINNRLKLFINSGDYYLCNPSKN
jgi:hypothetical protein